MRIKKKNKVDLLQNKTMRTNYGNKKKQFMFKFKI